MSLLRCRTSLLRSVRQSGRDRVVQVLSRMRKKLPERGMRLHSAPPGRLKRAAPFWMPAQAHPSRLPALTRVAVAEPGCERRLPEVDQHSDMPLHSYHLPRILACGLLSTCRARVENLQPR